ncbi:DUF5789 family protein [Halobaculum roseum]|uniref:DUF2795 domain-containing protein n=1 Tax=Halobaculum roseum TaxID=2175149 RepID=A0ABD5MJ73_9EURY|nr:hypothetical protein [Halobaculum roseum]QZY04281.1 hypothetical protein K6T36_16410 [Halobaculum roseum]
MSSVNLSRVESLFAELDYPISREEAAAEFSDVTVRFADGEGNLGEYVAACSSEEFHNSGELYTDIQNELPVEAVGEPGQSEGDA